MASVKAPHGCGSLPPPSGQEQGPHHRKARQPDVAAEGSLTPSRYTPVAEVLEENPPFCHSALHPLVNPVGLSPGFPEGLRFWVHPSPGPISPTGCPLVGR